MKSHAQSKLESRSRRWVVGTPRSGVLSAQRAGLAHYLEKRGIKNIYLMGLALDYCVKYSMLDARHLGLNSHVILDGCRGIEFEAGDIDRALHEMKRAGAVLLKSNDL